MCGIIGVFSECTNSCAALTTYNALNFLQHRGQDAAGIVCVKEEQLVSYRGSGLVRDVFNSSSLETMSNSKMSIGHVRYPTSFLRTAEDTQPFYVNQPYGIVMSHNGNLINVDSIQDFLKDNKRHINTHSDSELLLNLLACEIHLDQHPLSPNVVFEAVERLHQKVKGSYAVVALIPNFGLIAFRDPYGLRPLIYGVKKETKGTVHMLASESAALSSTGFDVVHDIAPGECFIITNDGKVHRKQRDHHLVKHTVCVFEYVYFARPDSVIDGISVYKARLRMGEHLAKRIKNEWKGKRIDSVIPVPESSRCAASAVAESLGVPFREGFVKNHYIGRTFISDKKTDRSSLIQRKLNVLPLEFKNKHVLIVDDSIVRGNTSKQIVQMAYNAGAEKVYLASASPPVCYPNVYGIDIATHAELIAHERSIQQVQEILGADALMYQTIEDLVEAVQIPNQPCSIQFDLSCFNGCYVTGDQESYILKNRSLQSEKQTHLL